MRIWQQTFENRIYRLLHANMNIRQEVTLCKRLQYKVIIQQTRSHATWTIAVADVYVNSVKRFLQTSQTFIFILLS